MSSLIYLIALPDDKFYVGIDISGRRINAHRAGKCKTTALHLNGEWPIMVPLVWVNDGDPGHLEGVIICGLRDRGFDVINRNFPRDFTVQERVKGKANGAGWSNAAKASAAGIAIMRAAGFPNLVAARKVQKDNDYSGLAKYHAYQKSAGYPNAAKGGAVIASINRKNGTGFFDPKIQAMGNAASRIIQRKNGTGIFDPEVRARAITASVASQRKNGTGIYDPKFRAKGPHTRWHVDRGITSPNCKLCFPD